MGFVSSTISFKSSSIIPAGYFNFVSYFYRVLFAEPDSVFGGAIGV